MRIKRDTVYRKAWHCDRIAQNAQKDERSTRYDKQPARAVHQKKAKRPPAVAIGLEMRGMGSPTIRMQGNWHFSDFFPIQTRLDDHFSREFHTGAAKIQALEEGLGKSSQAAIHVIDGSTKPSSGHNGEHRI